MNLSGKTLINVDIQPEYQKSFNWTERWIDFLNRIFMEVNHMVFLWNGPEVGGVDKGEFQMWLMEHGLTEEVLEGSVFIDKGYAFFRYCMDEGIDEENIVAMVRFMVNNDIHDSRDMDEEMWRKFI